MIRRVTTIQYLPWLLILLLLPFALHRSTSHPTLTINITSGVFHTHPEHANGPD